MRILVNVDEALASQFTHLFGFFRVVEPKRGGGGA